MDNGPKPLIWGITVALGCKPLYLKGSFCMDMVCIIWCPATFPEVTWLTFMEGLSTSIMMHHEKYDFTPVSKQINNIKPTGQV